MPHVPVSDTIFMYHSPKILGSGALTDKTHLAHLATHRRTPCPPTYDISLQTPSPLSYRTDLPPQWMGLMDVVVTAEVCMMRLTYPGRRGAVSRRTWFDEGELDGFKSAPETSVKGVYCPGCHDMSIVDENDDIRHEKHVGATCLDGKPKT